MEENQNQNGWQMNNGFNDQKPKKKGMKPIVGILLAILIICLICIVGLLIRMVIADDGDFFKPIKQMLNIDDEDEDEGKTAKSKRIVNNEDVVEESSKSKTRRSSVTSIQSAPRYELLSDDTEDRGVKHYRLTVDMGKFFEQIMSEYEDEDEYEDNDFGSYYINSAQNAQSKTDLATVRSAMELAVSSISTQFMGDIWVNDVQAKIWSYISDARVAEELEAEGYTLVSDWNKATEKVASTQLYSAPIDGETSITKYYCIAEKDALSDSDPVYIIKVVWKDIKGNCETEPILMEKTKASYSDNDFENVVTTFDDVDSDLYDYNTDYEEDSIYNEDYDLGLNSGLNDISSMFYYGMMLLQEMGDMIDGEMYIDVYFEGNDLIQVVVGYDYAKFLENMYDYILEENEESLDELDINTIDDFAEYMNDNISQMLDKDTLYDEIMESAGEEAIEKMEEYGIKEKDIKEMVDFYTDTGIFEIYINGTTKLKGLISMALDSKDVQEVFDQQEEETGIKIDRDNIFESIIEAANEEDEFNEYGFEFVEVK